MLPLGMTYLLRVCHRVWARRREGAMTVTAKQSRVYRAVVIAAAMMMLSGIITGGSGLCQSAGVLLSAADGDPSYPRVPLPAAALDLNRSQFLISTGADGASNPTVRRLTWSEQDSNRWSQRASSAIWRPGSSDPNTVPHSGYPLRRVLADEGRFCGPHSKNSVSISQRA
jgi:hypothetical protein